MVNEFKTGNNLRDVPSKQSTLKPESNTQQELAQFKSVSFFLERTAETIKRTTALIQELESEVARLKYELMATENEYKNLTHMNQDLEISMSGGDDLKRTARSDDK